jgi:hypothetical protein
VIAMTDQPENSEKKIIIDEDWKTRVQAEKEEAARAETGKEKDQSGQASAAAGAGAGEQIPLPPPSFGSLVSTLALQAMVAMGLVPDPAGGEAEVHLDHAKHLIDTIAMLEQKTEGNRTTEETTVVANVLHELRMGYVTVQNKAGTQNA